MNFKILNLFTLFTLLTLLNACSSKPPKNNPKAGMSPETAKMAPPETLPSIEAKQLANEQQTTYVTEFSFKKGSDELTPIARKKLKEFEEKALKKGEIDTIKVITWADQEYPSVEKKKLTKDQIALVEKRNEKIKSFLKTDQAHKKYSGDVELISMAQRPNLLSSLFSSEDERIKKSLESAGIPNSKNKEIKTAKSSRSIILILMK